MPTTMPSGGMSLPVASQSYKLSGLVKYESHLSPEFLASRGAMLSLYASLEGVIREVSALRRLGTECTSTFRRFQESLARVWEGGEGGSGPLTLEQRAFPPALEGTLALLQEDRLVMFLDRFTLGINGILLPAFEESQVLQQLVLDSLLERLRVAEASHALHDLAGKADAIVKSIAASSSFYTAAIAFAGKEAEAAAGFRQLFAKVRAEVVATAGEVCAGLERSSATFARAVGVAVGAVAELSMATSGEVGALALAPPGPGIAWLLEGGVGGEGSGTPSSSSSTTTATTTTLALLGGEKVIIGLEGSKNERTGVLGNLFATNYRLLWVPQHVKVEGASSSSSPSPPSPLSPSKTAASSGSNSEGGISSISSSNSSSSSSSSGVLRMSKLTSVTIKASGWSMDPNLVSTLGAPYHDGILSFPLCSISRLDAVAGAVIIVTSDMRVGAFSHTRAGSGGSAGDLVQRLSPMVWSPTPNFAVSHTLPTPTAYSLSSSSPPSSAPSSSPTTPSISPGWEFHSGRTLEREFERMMGHWPAARGLPRFRLAPDLNANYAICSTYPSTLIVPSSLTDAQLIAAAKYRSRGRLAAVVWFSGSVSLSRCAQPRSGLLAARSGDDERLLESLGTLERHLTLIREAAKRQAVGEAPKVGGDGGGGGGGGSGSGSGGAGGEQPQAPTIALSKVDDSVTLHIMDARPRINALVNSARGGGAENVANYKQCAMSYLNIDNIHFVRDALATLRNAILRTGRSDLVAWLHSEHSLRLGGWGGGGGGSGGGGGGGGGGMGGSLSPPTLSASFLSAAGGGGGEVGETSSLFASRVSIPSYPSVAPVSSPGTPSIRDWGGGGEGGAAAFSSPRDTPTSTQPVSPPTARPAALLPTTPHTPHPPPSLEGGGGEGEGEEPPPSSSKKSSIARFLKGTRRFLQGGKTKSEKAEREDAFLTVTRVSSVMSRTPSYGALSMSGPPSTPMPDSPIVGEGGEGGGWEGGEGEDKGVFLPATLRSPLAYKKPPKGSHAPHWFKLIATLLEGANAVAKSLLDGVSVVVHCSDGWDRTSGLTSLSLLLIDPHYRTLEGLCTLLAREWCNFGHKFGRRCGSGAGDHNREDSKDDQRAPIFLQFVDALWQVTRQHPTAFEFNERALAALVDHSYSGAFGTFLLDCEKERIKGAIPTSTPSLWDLFVGEGTRDAFTNPLYGRATLLKEGELAWGRETVDPALPLLPSRGSMLKLDCDVMSIALWPLWVLRFSQ